LRAFGGGNLPAWVIVLVRRLLFGSLLVAVATVIAVAACDGNTARTTVITCEKVYRVCPTLPPASPDEAEECADIFQGRCGAEMRQHIQCVTGKCDDAGAPDRVAAERACFATIEAYRRCVDGETEGGAGPDQGQLPPFSTDATVDR
jgi:hypothetical protein